MQELARPIPTVLASLGPWFKFQMPMSSCMILSKSLHLGHCASVSSSSKMCGILGTTHKINAQGTFSSFPPTIIKTSSWQASPGDPPPHHHHQMSLCHYVT